MNPTYDIQNKPFPLYEDFELMYAQNTAKGSHAIGTIHDDVCEASTFIGDSDDSLEAPKIKDLDMNEEGGPQSTRPQNQYQIFVQQRSWKGPAKS